MKRIIALIVFAIGLSWTNLQAQTVSAPSLDTLTNTDTVDLLTPLNYFSGGDGIFTVSVVAEKVSGTTAGNCLLQVTVDGTNWENLYGTSQDTFALANTSGAQVKNWFVSGVKPKRVRVRVLQTGTSVTRYHGYYIKK